MSYPKKLLRLRPTKGIIFDTPDHEVGPEYFTAGSNVIFRQGFAQRIGGARDTYTTAITASGRTEILHALNCNFSGTNYWLLWDANTVYSIESTNAVARTLGTPTTVSNPDVYSSALLNGVPIVTNGSDEPEYWGGSGNMAQLTDWTATESCKSLAVFKYHIFALDIDGPGGTLPSKIKWSAAAEPGTIPNSWTPSASNEAGDVELSDTPGAVLCAVPNRDTLLVYKKTAIYGCQYVGGNQVFAFTKLNSSYGALNRHSVCDIGNGQHLVVTQGDIVLTDGTNIQSIGQNKVKEYLFHSMDEDNYERLFCIFDREHGEAWVCFPSTGNTRCDTGLVYDVTNGSWGVRTLPDINTMVQGYVDDTTESNIWTDQSEAWNDAVGVWGSSTLTSATESLLHVYDNKLEMQDTTDATTRAATVGKYDIDFDEPERVKFIRRVHVRTKANAGTLFVRVGSRMSPTDSTTWSPEVQLVSPDQVVNTFTQGRYISVEIRSAATDVWTVTGIDIEAELRGYF
jgi:hypothetical protein